MFSILYTHICINNFLAVLNNAHSDKCTDGSQADGQLGNYFIATFSTSCDELNCPLDYNCIGSQNFISVSEIFNTGFAKCCKINRTTSNLRRRNKTTQQAPKFRLPLANEQRLSTVIN